VKVRHVVVAGNLLGASPEGGVMRALTNFSVPLACVWALLFPSIAVAEPIIIRSGVVEVGAVFTVRPFSVTGDRGFSLFGIIGNRGLDPDCGGGPEFHCGTGEQASLAFRWSGLDFTGVDATLDGKTYREINTLSSSASAKIDLLSGTVLLPDAVSPTVVLQAPFSLEGLFFAQTPQGEGVIETLVGRGTVTTSWTGVIDPDAGARWDLSFSRFEFADPAGIPEPGTLLLGGAAAAVAAISRRRRSGQGRGIRGS
jgi:PEP-CTERM motif